MSFYVVINADEKLRAEVVHRELRDERGVVTTDHFEISPEKTIEVFVIRIFKNDGELFAMRRLSEKMVVPARKTAMFDWTLDVTTK